MSKEKTKAKKSPKKKAKVEDVAEVTTTSVETPELAPSPVKTKKSLLPNSLSRPLEELKSRVAVLEELVAKLLGTQQ